MIEVKMIDKDHMQDINIPNEPFALWGRMIPSYKDEQWSYIVEHFDSQNVGQMCFPNENYDYMEMCRNSTFIGAYDGDTCIGLAILKDALLKYMYLYDLKVNKEYRNQGVASRLITKSEEAAAEKGYRGIYTQGQDNNLSACLFYLKYGFHIGGLDTNVYKGTTQEGKADILFYLDVIGDK
ncbi:MAG: GNAT family N-acetyltransferase [Lachnospiraceae bacterium]|nr:GNAT family N-acetyltransferase [Lachnospiraceae bacterium]MDE7205415.1 GNAT family N-acetyltransferase [Lachnospiraceae bacterium]